jgi:anti-sigma-K factor RskA
VNDHQGHDLDLAGAYVLDALEPEERDAFEHHLQSCAACRTEVAELRSVVDILPLVVEQIEPSTSLRERILADIEPLESELPNLTSLPGGVPRPAGIRRPWFERGGRYLAVAAAAVIVALGGWNVHLQQEVHNQPAAAGYYRDVAAAVASGASVWRVAGTAGDPAASAAMVQPRGHTPAYLLVHGLAPAPSHRVYQLWLMRGGKPTSAGVFSPSGSDPQVVRLPVPATGYTQTAVTVEPGPNGSPQPTTSPILLGRIGV